MKAEQIGAASRGGQAPAAGGGEAPARGGGRGLPGLRPGGSDDRGRGYVFRETGRCAR